VSPDSGLTFPRQLRLTKSREFRQVFEANFRQLDDSITILVSRHIGNNPRIGFAIAKKQVKKAVQRNHLKRNIRESFRRNQHRLPNRDMVVLVRQEILKLDRVNLVRRLDQHWNSIIKKCESSS